MFIKPMFCQSPLSTMSSEQGFLKMTWISLGHGLHTIDLDYNKPYIIFFLTYSPKTGIIMWQLQTMIGENRQLVTDEPVEFAK